jgi:hypothetical protein
MSVKVSFYGKSKPGPGVSPIQVVDHPSKLKAVFAPATVRQPFKKPMPRNWRTGKTIQLQPQPKLGNIQAGPDHPWKFRLVKLSYGTLTAGLCYVDGVKRTVTNLPTTIIAQRTTRYYVDVDLSGKTASWNSTTDTTFPDAADSHEIFPILTLTWDGAKISGVTQHRSVDIVVRATAPGSIPDGSGDGQIIYWDETNGEWKVSVVGALAEGDTIEWDSGDKKWVKKTPSPPSDPLPDGSAEGQILHWDDTNKAWKVSVVGALSDGDYLKWDGANKKWIKTASPTVSTTEITVVTDTRYDTSTKQLQKKTRTAKVVDPGAESAWTQITDGQFYQET